MAEMFIDQLGRVIATSPEQEEGTCFGCIYNPKSVRVWSEGCVCLKQAPLELIEDGGIQKCAEDDVIFVQVT